MKEELRYLIGSLLLFGFVFLQLWRFPIDSSMTFGVFIRETLFFVLISIISLRLMLKDVKKDPEEVLNSVK